jgi:hypothetical protein
MPTSERLCHSLTATALTQWKANRTTVASVKFVVVTVAAVAAVAAAAVAAVAGDFDTADSPQ